jgi:hypothetical protein
MKISPRYAEWGDTSIGFEKWWDTIGKNIITVVSKGVHLADEDTMSDENFYLFAIPKHLTARQTRDQAEHLMAKLIAENGKGKLAKWQLTESANAHNIAYRAYIHALDCHDKLKSEKEKAGNATVQVKPVEVLAKLRKYYIDKDKRYKGKGDSMPMRLAHGGLETDPEKINTKDLKELNIATQAVAAVRDYLKKGEATLDRVAKGFFP